MYNCSINDLDKELMIYYGYVPSASASNVSNYFEGVDLKKSEEITVNERISPNETILSIDVSEIDACKL
ncbi:MAG: hypothetical protein RBR71_01280 [Gudongella sp.]|nr:hypothetical protein [Gudongella sp.]